MSKAVWQRRILPASHAQLLDFARTGRKPVMDDIHATEEERQQALEFERVLLTTIGDRDASTCRR